MAGFAASSGNSPAITINDLPPANNNVGSNSEANPVLVDAFYVHPDHLGTPRVVTNPADNKKIWEWESTPFGESAAKENPQNVTGAGLAAAQFRFNLRFPGQVYDTESGKHYNYFRDYDSSTGRYVESDPIGLRGGVNTFGYVSSDPLGSIDIFGLCSCTVTEPTDKGHLLKDSKSNIQTKRWWQGEIKRITCTYKCICKCKNGAERIDIVRGAHEEVYGMMHKDIGNEGDCIGAQYIEDRVFNFKTLNTDTRLIRTRYSAFDPRASSSPALRDWGRANCEK